MIGDFNAFTQLFGGSTPTASTSARTLNVLTDLFGGKEVASTSSPAPTRTTGYALVQRPLAAPAVPMAIKAPALATSPRIPTAQPFLASDPSSAPVPIAYTEDQANRAAAKIPVTLIAAGVGAVAVGAFVLLQLRKKKR